MLPVIPRDLVIRPVYPTKSLHSLNRQVLAGNRLTMSRRKYAGKRGTAPAKMLKT
jgi:hypothetical protein